MRGRRWTREEDLAVLYVRHRGLGRFDPAIAELAGAMERTEASIWMRKGELRLARSVRTWSGAQERCPANQESMVRVPTESSESSRRGT